jgi:hypothetical protein
MHAAYLYTVGSQRLAQPSGVGIYGITQKQFIAYA